jgi:hypothetical protein
MSVRKVLAATVAGLVGGVAWRVGLLQIFGPAQSILADPTRQSAKMLGAFAPGADGPRMYTAPQMLWFGLLSIGVAYGWAYAAATSSWRGPWWRRGLGFGLLSWTLMTLWFEFYLPWNVLREPALLVGLELVCWLAVHSLVGVSIAGIYRLINRDLDRVT